MYEKKGEGDFCMKKLKYFLLAFVILLLAAGGYILYELKLKQHDVADEKVDEILEEAYTVELPDGTVITIDANGEIVDDGATASQLTEENNTDVNDERLDSSEANNGQATPNDKTDLISANASGTDTTTAGKPTVAQIKEKYRPAFASLESQAKSRLSGLIGQAKSEYSAKKANGESISYGYFYNKYMGAANSMEASTDAAVQSVISLVRKELEANGYSSSYADEFLKQYESSKAALRNSLMAEVKAAL